MLVLLLTTSERGGWSESFRKLPVSTLDSKNFIMPNMDNHSFVPFKKAHELWQVPGSVRFSPASREAPRSAVVSASLVTCAAWS